MQDMRRRYEVADEKIEQTTQTDFNLMLMDMHMDSDIFQMEQAATTPPTITTTTTATATAMATTNIAIRPERRTKKANWNETWGSSETTLAGLANVCMDMGLAMGMGGVEMGNVVPQTQSQATLLQLSNKGLTTTTTTTTSTTPAEIDFVHVLENPLPPSPHPPASVHDSTQLHSIDPCGMIHELSDVAAVGAAGVAAVTALPPPAYSATLETNSRGAFTSVATTPHRYETRRVVSRVKRNR